MPPLHKLNSGDYTLANQFALGLCRTATIPNIACPSIVLSSYSKTIGIGREARSKEALDRAFNVAFAEAGSRWELCDVLAINLRELSHDPGSG
jgi:hypothetical protein